MPEPTLRLMPHKDPLLHSQLRLSLDLKRPLSEAELMDLAQAVRAWTGRRAHVVLFAAGGREWWDEWTEALDAALPYLGELRLAESTSDQ
jgi:hypothetical protein